MKITNEDRQFAACLDMTIEQAAEQIKKRKNKPKPDTLKREAEAAYTQGRDDFAALRFKMPPEFREHQRDAWWRGRNDALVEYHAANEARIGNRIKEPGDGAAAVPRVWSPAGIEDGPVSQATPDMQPQAAGPQGS